MTLVRAATAPAQTRTLLKTIANERGQVPSYALVLANSPHALQAFIEMQRRLETGQLDKQTQARIALAITERNASEYCQMRHTAEARAVGLSEDEIQAAKAGTSNADRKAAALVQLAVELVDQNGAIGAIPIAAARVAGATEGEIAEVMLHIGLNVAANVLAKATKLPIDEAGVEAAVAS